MFFYDIVHVIDQDSESTGENRSMLAFFDSLIQRESLGDLGDAMDDSDSEDVDSDNDYRGRSRARTVNFDRWSDVESSGEEEVEGRTAAGRLNCSGDDDGGGEERDKNLPHHPANGVVSRLRRKMKYRRGSCASFYSRIFVACTLPVFVV